MVDYTIENNGIVKTYYSVKKECNLNNTFLYILPFFNYNILKTDISIYKYLDIHGFLNCYLEDSINNKGFYKDCIFLYFDKNKYDEIHEQRRNLINFKSKDSKDKDKSSDITLKEFFELSEIVEEIIECEDHITHDEYYCIVIKLDKLRNPTTIIQNPKIDPLPELHNRGGSKIIDFFLNILLENEFFLIEIEEDLNVQIDKFIENINIEDETFNGKLEKINLNKAELEFEKMINYIKNKNMKKA